MKEEKNYWPQGIVLIVLAVVILIIWTINTAVKNSIEMDSPYLLSYQQVDDNINELVKSQKLFEKEYAVIKETESFVVGKNDFIFRVESLQNLPTEGLEASCLLTRPLTTKEDQKIDKAEQIGNSFVCKDFEVKNKGRYQVSIVIKNATFGAFYNYEINSSM